MPEPLAEMDRISKAFAGVHALTECHLDLHPGKVHAPVGESGAGKSTVMKIPAGVYRPDAGSLNFKGWRVTIASSDKGR
jgi:ABC-type sugar transport system ATPase subunit